MMHFFDPRSLQGEFENELGTILVCLNNQFLGWKSGLLAHGLFWHDNHLILTSWVVVIRCYQWFEVWSLVCSSLLSTVRLACWVSMVYWVFSMPMSWTEPPTGWRKKIWPWSPKKGLKKNMASANKTITNYHLPTRGSVPGYQENEAQRDMEERQGGLLWWLG